MSYRSEGFAPENAQQPLLRRAAPLSVDRARPACRTGPRPLPPETRSPQGTRRISHAGFASARDLDALAATREDHGVFADDVAAANRVKAYTPRIAISPVLPSRPYTAQLFKSRPSARRPPRPA